MRATLPCAESGSKAPCQQAQSRLESDHGKAQHRSDELVDLGRARELPGEPKCRPVPRKLTGAGLPFGSKSECVMRHARSGLNAGSLGACMLSVECEAGQ